jgi:hypothetical protein
LYSVSNKTHLLDSKMAATCFNVLSGRHILIYIFKCI